MFVVKELGPHLAFISDSQDVKAIRESCGLLLPFDSFFVATDNGEYTEVWGMFGIVPFDNRSVYPVLF